MRHQAHPFIHAPDFNALKRFEAKHPKLYRTAPAPSSPVSQIGAFNAVFGHETYGEELKQMVAEAERALDTTYATVGRYTMKAPRSPTRRLCWSWVLCF